MSLRSPLLAAFLCALLVLSPCMAVAGGPPVRQGPPPRRGDCRWVHGAFVVANGSGVQRIWIIGTRRIVNIPDDDPHIPKLLSKYEKAENPQQDRLIADFHICALEDNRPGHMQRVSVKELRRASFQGRAFR